MFDGCYIDAEKREIFLLFKCICSLYMEIIKSKIGMKSGLVHVLALEIGAETFC